MARSDMTSNLQKSTTVPEFRSRWYFSLKDLEMNSPSRLDGIDWVTENQLRKSYCSFIQNLGMQLRVTQTTIATAIMYCHRFYLRQSHAKNDWETIASVCLFAASKVEESPCYLDVITSLAYQMKHRKNSAAAAQRIRVKEVFLRQKELILVGETLLLATIGFDFNVQHPHKILIEAVKRLSLPNTVARVAWNYLNDWMQTTLYLQYKPHYLAAGSIYLAAKINNVRLPYDKGHIWWQEFDVLPRQLDEAVQHMMEVMGYKKSVAVLAAADKTTAASSAVQERQQSNSSESCISSQGGSSPMVEYVCDRRPTLIKQDRHPNGLFPNTNSSSACGRSELKRQYLDSKCNGGVIHNENLKFTSQKTGLDCQRNTNAILTMPIRVNMNSETGRPRENPKRRRLEKCEIDEQHTCPRHFLGKRAVV